MGAIKDLNAWEWAFEEPSGDTDKQWLIEPGTGRLWLFKPNRPRRSVDEASSEVAASLLAYQLGLPAARVMMGQRDGTTGCISLDVIEDPLHGLVDGAILLSAIVDDFDPRDRQSRGHDQANIRSILTTLDAPHGSPSDTTASEAFCDYLMFDALIGNTDRHSKNWAVETSLMGKDKLAPTFDHATSMGITTRGPARDLLLSEVGRIPEFVQKATAYRFGDGQKDSLVDYSLRFARTYTPDRFGLWRRRLERLTVDIISDRIASSHMSADGATLAVAVVSTNRERILQCLT